MFANRVMKYNKMGLVLGLGLSVTVSSIFLYYYSSRWSKITDSSSKLNREDKDKDKDKYEDKYYDAFDKLEVKELEEDSVVSLKNSVLYEMTPKGRVIMYYDKDKESFAYYCDTKDVPYMFLETVARKYALTYDCKKLVVDIKKELGRAKDAKDAKSAKSAKDVVSGDKPNVYASFKNYNMIGEGGGDRAKYILRQSANRYSYSGKVNEFDFLKTSEYVCDHSDDKMDYETFKRLTAKKN